MADMAQLIAELQRLNQAQQDQAATLGQLQQRLDQNRREVEEARAREEQAHADRRQALEAALRLAGRWPDAGIVDGRGVGQPPKFSGKGDSEFQEGAHKLSCFASAKFGAAFQPALKWAATQRRQITADGADGTANYVETQGLEIEDIEER